jgi:hypothetical protein
VRCAPIAKSSDGLGGELPGEEPKWRAFGHSGLPRAEVGFAVASPVLRMAEGNRTVRVSLQLENAAELKTTALGGLFEVFLTGEKGWLRPEIRSAGFLPGDRLRFEMNVAPGEKAVVDYDAAIHGYTYTAQAPVVQFLLRAGGYDILKRAAVRAVLVEVDVSGLAALTLESDAGALDPKKTFLPFGPQPAAGSRFMIGSQEVLAKKLSEVKLDVQWQGVPGDLKAHYDGYGVNIGGNGYFTVSCAFRDGGGREHRSRGHKLFVPSTAASALAFTLGQPPPSPRPPASPDVNALFAAGSAWAAKAAVKIVLAKPVLAASAVKPLAALSSAAAVSPVSPLSLAAPEAKVAGRTAVAAALEPKPAPPPPPEIRSGFITLLLDQDFLHAAYRRKTVENLMIYAKSPPTTPPTGPVVLKEPYTPAVSGISLSYKAQSDSVDIGADSLEAFTNPDVQFFHAGCFGRMREHGYQRRQLGYVADKRVPLLPPYDNEGELLLGVSGVQAGDGVSVLFQVAEGSADPDLERQAVEWSVLCDNYWKKLGGGELALDTTNQLLASGIVSFVIPPEATVVNTILPAGLVWIKAAVRRHVEAVCQLIDVAANAVEVQFRDQGNDPAHLAAALPKGKITRVKTPIAAVKKVTQPYASFGGRPEESVAALNTRAAERLRHKNRCVTAWDYERAALAAFPKVHKAKCIPHAKDGAWLAPGHLLMVVVPDLRNANARDPLRPRVDADTLSRIAAYLEARSGMQTTIKVKNPDYQAIRLDFKVKLRTGHDFNFYSKLLNEELIRFLSPWAFDAEREISFGGRIYKSVLLDFVDRRPYVEYVTDFRMYSSRQGRAARRDLNEVRAERPDAILVSDSAHAIGEAR